MTPSPESITTPVNVLSLTLDEVHEAARARTACTAIYLRVSFASDDRLQSSQSLNVETLKHDLGGVFSVLGWIERRFSLTVSLNNNCGHYVQGERSGPRALHEDT